MAEDAEDKTEEPTDRKLNQAREQGQVMTSQEVKVWASLMAVLVVTGLMLPGLARDMKAILLPLVDHPHAIPVDQGALGQMAQDIGFKLFGALALPLATILVAGVAAAVAQSGFLVVPKRIVPEFSKINPWNGLKRLVSLHNLVEFAKSLMKMIAVGLVVGFMLWRRMDEFATLPTLDLEGLLAYLHHWVLVMIVTVMIAVTAVAGVDWFYQRWEFNEKMRMTKQEVKDEHKQTEGDPMVKSRIRSLRMQRARQRMMAAVPESTVVVTNPTHYACALKYDMDSMSAPILVAKGADFIAQRIREIAQENDVPLVENPPLARALYASVELDREIPPEHYKAVAEVIGYVMKLKGKGAN